MQGGGGWGRAQSLGLSSVSTGHPILGGKPLLGSQCQVPQGLLQGLNKSPGEHSLHCGRTEGTQQKLGPIKGAEAKV